MPILHTIALILLIASMAGFINQKWLRLPQSLAMAIIGILVAFSLFLLGEFGLSVSQEVEKILLEVDFSEFLLHGILGFLLFAGAMFFDVRNLRAWSGPIFSLATVGVAVSAGVTAFFLWGVAELMHMPLNPWWCALFGALIAPTDPIAVMSILRKCNAPHALEAKLVGESLFNDAMGIMLFLLVWNAMEIGTINSTLLFHELLLAPAGAVVLGGGLGLLTIKLMSTINDHSTEMLMTLALAAGSYALAERFHFSAPIAVVVAGLVMGHKGRLYSMSEESRTYIDVFWKGLEELLNAMLFLLMGLTLLVLEIPLATIVLGVAAWLVVLIGRASGVGLALYPFKHKQIEGTKRTLVWGGLRGGISLALVLSLPQGPDKTVFVAVTFFVVALSILGQGMTLERAIKPFAQKDTEATPPNT